jgi:hypothetical protein
MQQSIKLLLIRFQDKTYMDDSYVHWHYVKIHMHHPYDTDLAIPIFHSTKLDDIDEIRMYVLKQTVDDLFHHDTHQNNKYWHRHMRMIPSCRHSDNMRSTPHEQYSHVTKTTTPTTVHELTTKQYITYINERSSRHTTIWIIKCINCSLMK